MYGNDAPQVGRQGIERASMACAAGTGIIQPPEREMPRAVRMLAQEIDRFEALIDDLGCRISPVMSSNPVSPQGMETDKEVNAELPGLIIDRARNLAGLNARLASMIARIEL